MAKCSCRRCFCGTLIYVFALLALLVVSIFVVVPFIFKYSVAVQRNLIFPTWIAEKANFSDVESYIDGARNFYVTVDEERNITLGCWLIVPKHDLDNPDPYEQILSNTSDNIMMYFHGNGASRAMPSKINIYTVLRDSFLVVACDYRSYGDSTVAELTENHIVNDTVNLYNWLRSLTESRIFIWGHSLGTGVSTHTIANLKHQNYTLPTGLILESPFSSVPDVMEQHPIVKLFTWLPWFRYTILTPMEENGFAFDSKKYIVDVDCPIMILHAKDDSIISYEFALKLFNVAENNRQVPPQGNVTLYLFDEDRRYDHMDIFLAPELPKYLNKFVDECEEFEAARSGV